MSTLTLVIKADLTQPIETIFAEAMVLADKLQMIIEFPYRGIICEVHPDTDWQYGVTEYLKISDHPGKNWIASTKPLRK